jgi:hypothetical protein
MTDDSADDADDADEKMPGSGKVAKISRAALQVASGAIPFAGGALSAIAGAWSEAEQERVNRFFEAWIRMLQDEFKEKAQTILDIMARLNLQDEAIAARVESKEFQSLLNKAFREWAGVESEQKRVYIRFSPRTATDQSVTRVSGIGAPLASTRKPCTMPLRGSGLGSPGVVLPSKTLMTIFCSMIRMMLSRGLIDCLREIQAVLELKFVERRERRRPEAPGVQFPARDAMTLRQQHAMETCDLIAPGTLS